MAGTSVDVSATVAMGGGGVVLVTGIAVGVGRLAAASGSVAAVGATVGVTVPFPPQATKNKSKKMTGDLFIGVLHRSKCSAFGTKSLPKVCTTGQQFRGNLRKAEQLWFKETFRVSFLSLFHPFIVVS